MSSACGPAGNYYDKYGSRNPVARRLMKEFLRAFDELSAQTGVHEAHEVGCGEGELSLRLWRRGLRVRGCDVSPDIVAEARRRATAAGAPVEFRAASLYDLRADSDASPLIVCCEVLEHVPDPSKALEVLASLARPWLLVSVPREPLWRVLNLARFSYVTALGNTPGHLNHWSTSGFRRFLATRMEVVDVHCPFPWTMALCRGRE
jgi:SAM-dependent methyltransferase